MNIDSFKDAFDTSRGSCRGDCPCGKIYYNSSGGWDFEDGEIEKLEKNRKAFDLDCSIGFIRLEGKEYVWQCDCWKERALQVMRFIDSHNYQIAKYLNLERKRKIEEAYAMPEIK